MANKYTVTKDPIERFMEKVFKTKSCWIWLGSSCKGYGQLRLNNKIHLAHRWLYEQINGPMGNLLCCHTCDNPSCVNPDHLFAGTYQDNTDDMMTKERNTHKNKTHCPNGHPYSGHNLIIDGRRRVCRECRDERNGGRIGTNDPNYKFKRKIIININH